eukprot:11191771-Lingulodinium_polyedra.AAC.1
MINHRPRIRLMLRIAPGYLPWKTTRTSVSSRQLPETTFACWHPPTHAQRNQTGPSPARPTEMHAVNVA